jgi:hypothetical protein
MVAAEVGVPTVAAGSAAGDTSEVELRGPATAEVARVLRLPGPIEVEAAFRAPTELTVRRDPARTAAGHTVARPIARDTLVRMAAGLRRHQQAHVTVQLPPTEQILLAEQIQRQLRGITAARALVLIAA